MLRPSLSSKQRHKATSCRGTGRLCLSVMKALQQHSLGAAPHHPLPLFHPHLSLSQIPTFTNSSPPFSLKNHSVKASASVSLRLLQLIHKILNVWPTTASVSDSTSTQPPWHSVTAGGRQERKVGTSQKWTQLLY